VTQTTKIKPRRQRRAVRIPSTPTASPSSTTMPGSRMPTGRWCCAIPASWTRISVDISKPKRLHRKAARPHSRLAEDAGCGNAGRIKEDDSSVPAPDGPYAYLRKFATAASMKMFGRSPVTAARSRSLLDGDKLAADQRLFQIRRQPGIRRITSLEAWSGDIKGSEYFSIRVRDWNTRQDSSDLVRGNRWRRGSGTRTRAGVLIYVKLDDNHRPMQVWRHRLGTPAG